LSTIERKNRWQFAEQAGDATSYVIQHLLGQTVEDAARIRDELRRYGVEHLGHKGAIVSVWLVQIRQRRELQFFLIKLLLILLLLMHD
jgi:2-keto-4-pentenoate hydratase